jgi:hypothetical protein
MRLAVGTICFPSRSVDAAHALWILAAARHDCFACAVHCVPSSEPEHVTQRV